MPHSVHHAIFQQAERTPDALAVVDQYQSLTFRELTAQAADLSRRLAARGIGQHRLVGIAVERSCDLIVGLLGIIGAGAAYVPLDPSYPSERLRHMCNSLPFALILGNAISLPQLATTVPCALISGTETATSTPLAPGPDDLIYAIFTSGSTGTPKAAGVYHRGFANLARWYIDSFALTAADRVLVMSSPSFDLTQKNLFAPLIVGAQVHLLPPGPFDPGIVATKIAESGITLVNCTPSAFYPLVESAQNIHRLKSLRWVILGGEPIALSRLAPSQRALGYGIANSYGPTECADVCAFHLVTDAELAALPARIPIGRAVPGCGLAVVDEHLQLVPVGTEGELIVSGIGVGAGYLNDPELTAQRFIPDPDASGARRYRTGDRVCWHADGTLDFLGRWDQQVKISGVRIELGEIETALARHPAVKECVVSLVPTSGEATLTAWWVAKPGSQATAESLREFLQRTLQPQAVPSVFCHLSALPLSPNGKVDRRALLTQATAVPSLVNSPVRGKSVDLDSIAALWSTILGQQNIPHDVSFFALGGTSLAAIKLQAELQHLLQREIPISVIFQHPTVRSQVAAFSAAPSVPTPDYELRAQQRLAAASRRRVRESDV